MALPDPPRLPAVHGDDNNWGDILNAFLSVSLNNPDGTLKTSAVSDAGAEVTSNKDTDGSLAANSDSKYSSQKAVKTYVDTKDGQNVKITGAQTVAGNKTFTGTVTVDDGSAAVSLGTSSGKSQLAFGPTAVAADTAIKRTDTNQLDFGAAKLKNAADPTDAQDVATKNYVDSKPSSGIGTLANLPASGSTVGQTYYATDSSETYIWSGSSWTLPNKPTILHDFDMMSSDVWNPAWISAPQYGSQHAKIKPHIHRGQFYTSTATDVDSTRQVFLRKGTNWYNSEIHSIWYGNSPFFEIQLLSMSGATGGTFTISFSGQTTAAIAYNASAADVQSALAALSNIGAGNVEVGLQNQSAMPNGIYTIHLIGNLADKQNMFMTTTSSLTGSSPTVKIVSPYIPQMGHMHRAYDTGNGNYTSIMVDNNVIYQLYNNLNLQAWGFNGALTQGDPSSSITSPTPTWNIVGYQRWNFGVYIHDYRLNDVSGLRKGMSIKVSGCTDTSFNGNFIISDINPTQGWIRALCTNSATQNNVVSWQSEAYPAASVVGSPNLTTDGVDWTTAWKDNPVSFFPYHVRTAVYEDKLYAKLWRVTEKEPDKGIVTAVQSSFSFSGETVVLPVAAGNPGYCGLIVNHLYGGAYMEYGNVEFKRL